MGPKKKSKANKLARMTEEERARYLQHRAAIEEEARRRKQQLIATFMKNKLKREEAFTRLNQAKINQQWRQILRRMKTTELKQDLQNLWNTFDHAIERKNKHIQGLLKELDESEEQYASIFQSHAEITDALIVMHEERLSKLHLAYENDRRKLVQQTAASDSKTKQEARDDEEYISMLLCGLDIQMTEYKSKRESHDTAAMDELRNTMLYNSEQMQTEKEFTMEKLWRKFIMVLTDYAKETEPKRLQYSRLKSRDAESSSTITEHLERIDQLNEKINNHKQQLLHLKKEQEFKSDKLKMERDNFLRYFKIMRKRLDNGRNLDQSQLMMLTVQSNDCIKHLNMLLNKGEQILRLCFMCRKMETEREKVIPFGCELLSEDAIPLEYDEKQQIIEPFHQDMCDISKLEHFWKRYSHVYLESLALKIHQDALKLENKQLQGAVRQYMATIAQVNGRKDIETPLIGARPNTTRPIRKHITLITGEEEKVKRVRPVTCIEASTSIAVKHLRYFKSKFKV